MLPEHVQLARLAADQVRRAAVARTLRSPLIRWCLAPSRADELLIVPPDLRTPDPTFLDELAKDQFGLAGSVVRLGGRSPFVASSAGPAWQEELHGFGWLRHLRLAMPEDAEHAARESVADWLALNKRRSGIAFRPHVIARRVISWISHSDLLLAEDDARAYATTADDLAAQVQLLAATWREASAGLPRLCCVTALLYAALCLAGYERRVDRFEAQFLEELERQILPEGGHVSRNPGAVVQLLLDLLPLRQCYAARELVVPPTFLQLIEQMLAHLKHVRRGDGSLARFNGMSRTEADALATLLGYDDGAPQDDDEPRCGFYRLQRGDTVIIIDAGGPPPLAHASEAHAGCLAFEMSDGPDAVLVNTGAPGRGHEAHAVQARATASHNTLCLNSTSSSRLVRARFLERHTGAAPLHLPERISAEIGANAGALSFAAAHDGYLDQFGLIHTRRLTLSDDGRRVQGLDLLGPVSGVLRLKRDVPFAIHFHVSSDAVCRHDSRAHVTEIQVSSQATWRLSATGAHISVEQSQDYAHLCGPRPSMQIVLRGACPGESAIAWSLEKLA